MQYQPMFSDTLEFIDLGGAESDATASPPQSDDEEGSTAATIGSTMRNEAVSSTKSRETLPCLI